MAPTATLTLGVANSYTGGTTINGGTLSVGSIADSPTASDLGYGTLTFGGGTLNYTGGGISTTTRGVTWRIPLARFSSPAAQSPISS